MTFIFFVLFVCTSRNLCHWWTNFPLKVCLDVTHEHIHIENRNRDLCGYLRHVGLSTQKSRFRGFPRWHLMACVKIRLLAIKQRALKWYTKLSVHCSQFLFSGLLHPLQPSCFQITLRSQSSHESAAAESLSVYNLTARPLVTYWSNTEKVFAGNEFEHKIHV